VPSQVNRTGMLPPLVMALLVSEKPLVCVELGSTIVVGDGAEEAIGIEVAGIEVAGIEVAGVKVALDDLGTVDEEFKTTVDLGVRLGTVVVVVGAVGNRTVVVGALVRGPGIGRWMPFDLGVFRAETFRPEVLKATEADAMLPVVTNAIVVIVVIVVIQRAAFPFVPPASEIEVEEVFCFVMTSRYGVTLNRHWGSRNTFRQLLQRFLRLGS
jgi:hypothetical protein